MPWFKLRRLWVTAALLLSFGAVVYFYRPQPSPTVTSLEESKQSSTTSADRSQTVTRTRITKPDGTVIEQKQQIKKDVKVKEQTSENKRESVTTIPVGDKTRYRIGADWLPSIDTPPSVKDSELRAGARVGDSPIWIEGGYDFKHGQAKIGLSVEF